MRRFLFALFALSALTLFALTWLTSLPNVQHFLGRMATDFVHRYTNIPAHIAWIHWEPLRGTVTVGDIAVVDSYGDAAVEAAMIEADIKWSALQVNGLALNQLTVYGLRLNLLIDEQYRIYPFEWLLTGEEVTKPVAGEPVSDPTIEPLEQPAAKDASKLAGGDFNFAIDRVKVVDADVGLKMLEPSMLARVRDADIDIELDGLVPKSFHLDCRAGSYQILDWRYEGINIAGDGTVNEQMIEFSGLNVQVQEPNIDARVFIDIPLSESNRLVSLDIDGQVDSAATNFHYTLIPEILGTLDADVKIDVYDDRGIEMEVAAYAGALAVQSGIVRDFSTHMYMDQGGMTFDRISADLGDGRLDSTGEIRWATDIWLAFDTRLENVDLDYARGYVEALPLAPDGTIDGRIGFRFDIDPDYAMVLTSSSRLSLRKLEIVPDAPVRDVDARADVRLEMDEQMVRLSSVRYESDFFSGAVTAEFPLTAESAQYGVAGTVHVSALERLNIPDMDMSGAGDATYSAINDTIRVGVTAQNVRMFQADWDRVLANLKVFGDELTINDIEMVAEAYQVFGWAQLTSDYMRADLTLVNIDLAKMFPAYGVRGIGDGELNFLWPKNLIAPWVKGDISVRNAGLYEFDFGDIALKSNDDDQGRIETRITSTLGSDIVAVVDPRRQMQIGYGKFNLALDERWSTLLDTDRLQTDLRYWSVKQDYFAHMFVGSAELRGGAVRPSSTALASITLDREHADAVYYANGKRINGRLSGSYDLTADRLDVGGRIRFEDPFWFDFPADKPRGTVALDLAFGLGSPLNMSGLLTVADVGADLGPVAVAQEGQLAARLKQGVLRVEQPLQLTLGQLGRFSLQGGLHLGQSWDLGAAMVLPLSMLEGFDVGIKQASGNVTFDGRVLGDWLEPKFLGQGQIAAERLALNDLSEPLEQLSGDLRLSGESIQVSNLTGRIGDGAMTASGRIDLAPERLGDMRFAARIDTTRVRVDRTVQTGLTGQLNIVGNLLGRQLVNGDLEISNFTYDEDIAWDRALGRANRSSLLVASQPDESQLELDLRLTGRRDLRIDTNLFRGRFSTDLRVQGTIQAPTLNGLIELETGAEFFFRGQTYRIRRGSIQFLSADDNKPFLDIEAVSEIRYRDPEGTSPDIDYRISLFIFGPIDQLQIRFESDPALDETDIVTLLSLGILADDFSADRLDTLEISSLILSNQISRLEREIQTLIGFDRIDIEPAFDNSEGSSTMQVTLQKQIAKNLRLRLSTALDANADQRIELGYRVGKGVDLSVGWDNRTDNAAGNFFTRPRFVVPLP